MLGKRKILYFFSLFIGILLFLGLIFYFNKKHNFFLILFSLLTVPKNYIFMFLFLIFSLVYFLISAYKWKGILKAFNINISFFKLLKYKLSGFSLSYITPTNIGGEPVRVFLVLKELNNRKKRKKQNKKK